jgi:hypothetical protein
MANESPWKLVLAALIIALVAFGIGALAFPREKAVASNCPAIPACPSCNPSVVTETQTEYVNVSVFDLGLFRDNSWKDALEDNDFTDKLIECDGDEYLLSEMTFNWEDEANYSEDNDNKYFDSVVKVRYRSSEIGERCSEKYAFSAHYEEGEDPEFELVAL